MSVPAPPLSINHEKFCLAYVETGDAAEAYYRVSPNVKRANAKRSGCDWLKNPNIIARIAELRGEIVQETKITIEDCIREFDADRRKAREKEQYAVSIKATENIAKLLGYWVEKQETTHKMTVEEARRVVNLFLVKHIGGGDESVAR